MLYVVNALTILWLMFLAARSVARILAGERAAGLFATLVHFAFFGLPLLWDVVFGIPAYKGYPGLRLATRDGAVRFLYCLHAGFCPLVWWPYRFAGGRKQRREPARDDGLTGRGLSPRLRLILIVLLVSPAVFFLYAPTPAVYEEYAAVVVDDAVRAPTVRRYHSSYVALPAMLSVIAGAGILLLVRRLSLSTLLLVAPWMFLAIWVHGKRNLVLIAMAMTGYVFWRRGILRGPRLIVAASVGLLLFGIYSVRYQRTYQRVGRGGLYENVRIDYGRDDRMKLALYAELNPKRMKAAELNPNRMNILEYRGQSVLFSATMYIPRRLWSGKPWPYAVYATAAALRIPPRHLGWGMTTSWLDEAVANFGWAGLLLGPLLILLICRMGDASADTLARALTVLVVSLLLVVHLVAFAPVAALWFAVWVRSAWLRTGCRVGAHARGYQEGHDRSFTTAGRAGT